MPVLQQYTSSCCGIWKIEETWEELLSLLTDKEAYIPFLNRSKSDTRKAEWLAARVLLKTLLGKETLIAYHANGTPYLPESHLHISISHTKGYAAVLLNTHLNIGIDIEYISERIRKIYTRFLNKSELCLIGEQPDTETLLVCWSAKETAFKMTGQASVDWRKDLQILSFNPIVRQLSIREKLTPQSETYSINYMITPEFVITQSAETDLETSWFLS